MNKFNAKIITEKYSGTEEEYLSITHNGYQWSSLRLSIKEMKVVRDLLDRRIKAETIEEGKEKND